MVLCAVIAGFVALAQESQTVVVHSNAVLRQSASTSSAALAHLTPGMELTLLTPPKRAKFYHVRTPDGQEGWVYQTLVHIPEENEPEPPAPPPPAGIASQIDPTWGKPTPVGSKLQGPPGANPPSCPADGEDGGDNLTNHMKNRIDVPTDYHPIAFTALSELAFPNANTDRRKWSTAQLNAIAPYEGGPVSIIGYIVAVKPQFGGSGESTNCHYSVEKFVDTHMALVEQAGSR